MTSSKTQDKIEQIRTTLNEGIAALADSAEWRRMLDYLATFHQYSVSNVLLIASQCPGATHVAGFKAWKEKGRQVRKGEKGIRIFGYRSYKVRVDEAGRIIEKPNGDEGEEKVISYYPLLSVFDISQTEVIEGFDDPMLEVKVNGTDDMDICGKMRDWLATKGWDVSFEAVPGAIQGFTRTDGSKRIVIDKDDDPANQAATLIHEAAHAILHADDLSGEYVNHRGMKETEAESVAYVVAKMAGLDTFKASVHYVAGWSRFDPDVLEEAAGNVRKAAVEIAEGLGIDAK